MISHYIHTTISQEDKEKKKDVVTNELNEKQHKQVSSLFYSMCPKHLVVLGAFDVSAPTVNTTIPKMTVLKTIDDTLSYMKTKVTRCYAEKDESNNVLPAVVFMGSTTVHVRRALYQLCCVTTVLAVLLIGIVTSTYYYGCDLLDMTCCSTIVLDCTGIKTKGRHRTSTSMHSFWVCIVMLLSFVKVVESTAKNRQLLLDVQKVKNDKTLEDVILSRKKATTFVDAGRRSRKLGSTGGRAARTFGTGDKYYTNGYGCKLLWHSYAYEESNNWDYEERRECFECGNLVCNSGYYFYRDNLNFYNNDCLGCPKGQSQNERGQPYQCKSCTTGQYQDQNVQSVCKTDCNAGSFINPAKTACTGCPSGQYQDKNGQSNCKSCSSGQYQDQTGKTSCKFDCSAGSYINADKSACLRCPTGQYQDVDDQSACKTCSKGKYQSSNTAASVQCEDCLVGRYIVDDGNEATEHISCKTCPLGYEFVVDDMTKPCDKCAFSKVRFLHRHFGYLLL